MHLLLTNLVNFECVGGVKWAGDDIINSSSPFADDWFGVSISLKASQSILYSPNALVGTILNSTS